MDFSHQAIAWSVFAVTILVMLLLDLGVFNRKEKDVSMSNALLWCFIWISSAFVFCGGIYFGLIDAGGELKLPAGAKVVEHGGHGEPPVVKEVPPQGAKIVALTPEQRGALARQNAIEFLTGYIIEEMLSVDNLFVFVLIFQFFRVPPAYQRNVLYLGILGAIVLRAIFIAAGIVLIEMFHWIIYVFGAFLVYTGIKLMWADDDDVEPEKNLVLRVFRRFFRVTTDYHGRHYIVKIDGRRFFTPLAVVLLVVETTDLIFAVDSIPAILGITRNPFIVYTSNVFAIMGLRSLYFALAGLMQQFHYLKYGLSIILTFVGVKMLASYWYHMPTHWALGVVLGTLVLCVIASILFPPKHPPEPLVSNDLPTQPAEEGGQVQVP